MDEVVWHVTVVAVSFCWCKPLVWSRKLRMASDLNQYPVRRMWAATGVTVCLFILPFLIDLRWSPSGRSPPFLCLMQPAVWRFVSCCLCRWAPSSFSCCLEEDTLITIIRVLTPDPSYCIAMMLTANITSIPPNYILHEEVVTMCITVAQLSISHIKLCIWKGFLW